MARYLVLFLLLSAAWESVNAQQAPSCRYVAQMISPCMAYLEGQDMVPYGPCCGGMAALNRTALTGPDRATVCGCLKGIAPRLPLINLTRAADLPRACGVSLNVIISPSEDCNSLSPP
ncbi:Non-specific lipid-transfer protein [Dendrobium catenatum]|uniref:Non-specific lipid-transfer protein n=1 Tax=Dendrobium catenatum TaxID=906689 RepID=A0A2I0XBQ0_9ASPA|nr:Non-specific lipid-transfer protein [Dendrobium catenatum]